MENSTSLLTWSGRTKVSLTWSAEAGAVWSGPGRGGGSRAVAMARDELDGRRHGPGAEDAEVRGGAGRAGEDDDEAWGRPAWGRRGGTAGWG